MGDNDSYFQLRLFVKKYFNGADGPSYGVRCAYYQGTFRSDPERVPFSPFPMKTFFILSILLAPLAVMFVGSLAAEDQRAFLTCRANGASVDACHLLISGR